MICSATELNLGADHSGILVLPACTAPTGAPLLQTCWASTTSCSIWRSPRIAATACQCVGMAREIANAYDLDYVDPADIAPLPVEGEALPVTIDPGTGVLRFGLRPVTGIDPKAVSPWWMQRRLLLSGIRAISPAVDVTNYVMLELGHPMHAHDRSLITGGFRVRFAEPGETVVTLDDIERRLDPADVLIVDDVATAAIGGVMGAGTTEVRDSTTDVLLEAAVWDPAAVSRTQRRLHLASEAGRRYERTVDPAISVAALDRCSALLAEIAGGTVEPTLTDWRGDPPRDDWSPAPVSMAIDLPDRVGRSRLPEGHHRASASHRSAPTSSWTTVSVTATPPSWRPDLRQPADLVEEVLRLEGLEIIPSVLPLAPPGRGLSADAEAAPCDRKVAGAGRLRGDPAHPVPARGRVRPVGPAGGRSAADHHAGDQSVGGRPAAIGHDAAAGIVGGVGAQRVSRGRRYRVVRDRAGRRADDGNPRRGAHPDRPSPHLRRDRDARRVAAASATARRRGADRPARAARARGVEAGPFRPAMRSRRCVSSAAPPASS